MHEVHICANPLCGREVHTKKAHVEINGTFFCGLGCMNEWLEVSVKLCDAANPFSIQTQRKKWWERL